MPKLSDPNAPTRVSGFWRVPLFAWARARNKRLPDRGGLLPYKGARRFLPDGTPGGEPRGVPGVNVKAATQPILKIPAGLAARAEVKRREIRRARIVESAPVLALSPGLSGLDYAQGPRIRPRTPSQLRGALRDQRRPASGVQFYQQSVAPASIVEESNAARILANGLNFTKPGTKETVDGSAATDMNKALRIAVGTTAGATTSRIQAEASTGSAGLFPLFVVGAIFFFVFVKGRGV